MKYLGVWLDENLNFDDQAEYAASKATRAFTKIDRLMSKRKRTWATYWYYALQKFGTTSHEVFSGCIGVYV